MKFKLFIGSRSTEGSPIVFADGKWQRYDGDYDDFAMIHVIPLVDEGKRVMRRNASRFSSLQDALEHLEKENAVAMEILPDEYSRDDISSLAEFCKKFELPAEWETEERKAMKALMVFKGFTAAPSFPMD